MHAEMKRIIIIVADMAKSMHFYRDLLGLKPIFESGEWSEYAAGSFYIALHPGHRSEAAKPEQGTDAGALTICFTVPDLEQACADLRKKGVEIDGPRQLEGLPPMATFSDPDGISLELERQSGEAVGIHHGDRGSPILDR